MWSLFTLIFGGGIYAAKCLCEGVSHSAIERDEANNKIIFDGLYKDMFEPSEAERTALQKYREMKLNEAFEPIREDLLAIFGDVDMSEYFLYRKSFLELPHEPLYREYIPLLLESKNGHLPFFSKEIMTRHFEWFGTKEDYLKWPEIKDGDTWSYKSHVELRLLKKIEENIRIKYPKYTLVFPKIWYYEKYQCAMQLVAKHRVGIQNYHFYRRLWDDNPLTPDTAPPYNPQK